MKRTLLTIALALTLSGSSRAIASDPPEAPEETLDTSMVEQADVWMTYQYILNSPEEAPEMIKIILVKSLSRADDKHHAMTLINIFLSQLGREHIELLDDWTQEATSMSADAQVMFAYAIWFADPENSEQRIRKIVDSMPGEDDRREALLTLHEQEPPDLKEFKPVEAGILDYWWVSFLATGDTEYVGKVMEALPPRDQTYDEYDDELMKIAVAGSAIWSLQSNAFQHPKILQYIKERRADEKGEWPVLDGIIEETDAKLETEPSPAQGVIDRVRTKQTQEQP